MKKLEDFSKTEQLQFNIASTLMALKDVLIDTPELKEKLKVSYEKYINQMISEAQNSEYHK